jgi:hypothetical protein
MMRPPKTGVATTRSVKHHDHAPHLRPGSRIRCPTRRHVSSHCSRGDLSPERYEQFRRNSLLALGPTHRGHLRDQGSSRQAANLARISMPTAKQKHSAAAPSCPATMRTEAMKGEGGDYLISLRKEGSHRSRSIVRIALIAPGGGCKSGHRGLTHFRQSSFLPDASV